jgi:aryl carrier-like protein
MIPAFMTQIEALPVTPNGKLDKHALPDPDILDCQNYVSPGTAKEQAVIEIFEEILGVAPIGIEDSFFELGGDSIKAIRVVTKLRQKGYELTVGDLMRQRTARLISNLKVGKSIHKTIQASKFATPITKKPLFLGILGLRFI